MTPEESPIAVVARPVNPEAAAERLLRDAPTSSVLVVDDDDGIRNVLAAVLEELGYRVTVAADGEEAADILEVGFHPSAIVLDMMMPRMDGWAFLSTLRANPKLQDIRVLVASAVVGEPPLGADALLQKPFDIGQLHRAVARLCAH
jgi:CheY-like chemotaxis protein